MTTSKDTTPEAADAHTGGGNAKGSRRRFGSIRKLPSGRWRGFYTGPDGLVHNAPHTFQSKGDADAWLAVESSKVSRGRWKSPAQKRAEARTAEARRVTLAEFATEALVRRRLRDTTREATDRLMRRCVLPTFGQVVVGDITPQAVNRWYGSMSATPTQQSNAYGLLRSVMRDAMNDELIERNPCRVRGGSTKTRAREPVALSAAELGRYLAAITNDNHRTALMLAGWCALRSGEVRGLRRRDLDLYAGVVRVEQQAVKLGSKHVLTAPKTAAGVRNIAIPPQMLPVLREWLSRQPLRGADGLLFAAPDGVSPLSQQTLRDAHVVGRDAIGRPGLTIHGLRHTGLTLAAQAGATAAELMARAGHSTAAMAMKYQHTAQDRDVALALRMAELATVAGDAR